MHYSDDDLRAAAAAGVINAADAEKLLAFLAQREPATTPSPTFDMSHLLWYAGALIVITAMGLFSTLAFSQMGGRALIGTALVYAVAFTWAGYQLWYKKNLRTPGGLLVAVAVSMAPLLVYGIQDELGWWGTFGKPGAYNGFYVWIKGSWIFMEIATVIAGLVALRFFRFPFIVLIIAFALWFMSMDIAPWIAGTDHASWTLQRQVSIGFGFFMLLVALVVDYEGRNADFAFWLHIFGLLTFWGGITASEGSDEFGKAIYCLLNIGLIALSLVLVRRVYAVFGTIGVSLYLEHLAEAVFKNSLLFPFALSLIGIAVIALGLLYHRKQAAIAAWVDTHMPQALQRLRPAHAR